MVLLSDDRLGGGSVSIAPNVRYLIDLSNNINSALLIKKRLQASGIENVHIIVGDKSNLPFKSNSFHNICYHGTRSFNIPWIASKNMYYPIIEEADRILVERGSIYNSFNFSASSKIKKFFMGIKVRFISNFFKKKGFSKISVIFHYPSLDRLHFIREIPVNKRMNLSHLFFYIKMLLKGNNCCFYYLKDPDNGIKRCENNFIESIINRIEKKHNIIAEQPILIRNGSSGTMITDIGDYIVRMPQTKHALEFCQNNYNSLSKLALLNLPYRVPETISYGIFNGQEYFIEKKIHGISLDLTSLFSNKINESITNQAFHFLINDKLKISNMTDQEFNNLVEGEFIISLKLLEKYRNIIIHLFDLIKDKLTAHNLPLVIKHGDFKSSNFIYSRRENIISGIIDWEYSDMPGLPLFDLFTLLAYDSKRNWRDPQSIIARFWELACTADENYFIMTYLKEMGIPLSVVKPLCLVFMITHLNRYYLPEVMAHEYWQEELISKGLIPICTEYLDKKSV